MNTPAHLILASAAFARKDDTRTVLAALAGGFAPDASLYIMAGWCLFVLGLSPTVVFDQLYFSEAWQQVFAIDNSFLLWGAFLALGFVTGSLLVRIFAGSGLLHVALDFPLHHDDGRPHFWPLSDWVFESPVSYWDGRHYGNIVGPIEVALVALCALLLWRRFKGTIWAWYLSAIALLQIAPFVIFGLMFG